MGLFRLLARTTIGLLFVGHGTQKLFGWFGGGGLEGTAWVLRAAWPSAGAPLRPGRAAGELALDASGWAMLGTAKVRKNASSSARVVSNGTRSRRRGGRCAHGRAPDRGDGSRRGTPTRAVRPALRGDGPPRCSTR
jgi:hypothetical protein